MDKNNYGGVLHMSIWAIGDLHLSGFAPKPMDVFGPHWLHHWDKIQEFWHRHIGKADTVLLAGDHSWAMRLAEAIIDLEQIATLPGKKILIRGNHDYWWDTVSKVNKAAPPGILAIQANFTAVGNWAICGTRGWLCPGTQPLSAQDTKIHLRELGRLELALSQAKSNGFTELIALLHYPPVNELHQSSGFTDLLAQYQVKHCIYGHLHDISAQNAYEGLHDGISYHLVACDHLDFRLKKII